MTNPQLFIQGGQPLRGSVRVGGSKNAADYALAACLLTGDEVTLDLHEQIGVGEPHTIADGRAEHFGVLAPGELQGHL